MASEQPTHIADPERRMLVNAQGAVAVVHESSAIVDEEFSTIADQTDTQATEMRAVVEDVADLSATIEEIAASAQEVHNRSTRASEEVSEGVQAARRATDRMDTVHDVATAVATEVDRLTDRIDHIESALAGIDDIADQTNMLALNASIEAARADGESEGFAVVADEIKALAGQAQDQSDEIEQTLAEVREATDATVDQLDDALDEIDASTGDVEAAVDALDSVADVVEATVDDVATVSDVTDEQASVSESVATTCERAADRAEAIETGVGRVQEARAEQTAMLGEIEDALDAATPTLAVEDIDRIPTGTETIDEVTSGGLLVGGRSVLRYETVPVDDIVARLCGAALAAGFAVSVTPTPSLERLTLSEGCQAAGSSLRDALSEDRLFVLDMFDTWRSARNVFDVGASSLGEVNETTAERRNRPLLIVGNIAGEIAVLGEEQARAARYENDSGVFEPSDTVCNVVDDGTLDDAFAAFYAGAADQVLRVDGSATRRTAELLAAPSGSSPPRQLTASGDATVRMDSMTTD